MKKLFLQFLLLLLAFVWILPQDILPQETISVHGAIKYDDAFHMVETGGLKKVYTAWGDAYLQGKMHLANGEVFYFGDLGVVAYKENAKLLSDNRLQGFIWGSKTGLTSVSAKKVGSITQSQNQWAENYGLYIQDGKLLGYAWSDDLGWICFGGCIGSVSDTTHGVSIEEKTFEGAKILGQIMAIKDMVAMIAIAAILVLLFIPMKELRAFFHVLKPIQEKRKKPPTKKKYSFYITNLLT